jgi:heme-degrading protein
MFNGQLQSALSSEFPAGSLYGLNNSNPFNPVFQQQGTAIGYVPGGIITFGGGVPLYSNGQVIGGLGVSGDTACADHAIAFRMRKAAKLDGTPGGAGADNIQYLNVGDLPHDFGHPHLPHRQGYYAVGAAEPSGELLRR